MIALLAVAAFALGYALGWFTVRGVHCSRCGYAVGLVYRASHARRCMGRVR